MGRLSVYRHKIMITIGNNKILENLYKNRENENRNFQLKIDILMQDLCNSTSISEIEQKENEIVELLNKMTMNSLGMEYLRHRYIIPILNNIASQTNVVTPEDKGNQ
jgi:hypothetical protein